MGMAVRQPGVNSLGFFARATRLQPELAYLRRSQPGRRTSPELLMNIG